MICAVIPDVLDSSAALALLRNEPGADVVLQLISDPTRAAFIHSLNLCEVYYNLYRECGPADARQLVAEFVRLGVNGVTVREDMDDEFWHDVGDMKAIHVRVSLADCCAISLARRLSASLVTSDHHEFDPLVDANLCAIRFIR